MTTTLAVGSSGWLFFFFAFGSISQHLRKGLGGTLRLAQSLGQPPPLLRHGAHLVRVQVNRAAAARVPGVEEEVDVRLRHLQAHADHRATELLTSDLAVAVLVPLPEEVHDTPRVLQQRLLELLPDGHARVLINVEVAEHRLLPPLLLSLLLCFRQAVPLPVGRPRRHLVHLVRTRPPLVQPPLQPLRILL
eukprot:scaffold25134_cov58-Phaeocystis_antarctica.AAC.3